VAKKQIILFSLIVCLPLAMLAWLGWRLAREERGMVQQQLSDLALKRLEDADLVVAKYFQQRQRELLELTDLDDFTPDSLRQIVRDRPEVGQLFVLHADGRLLHPDPAGELNDSEREFLLHARQTLVDKDLIQNGGSEERGSPAGHGWHVRYWGPGLNLIFHHRLPSGNVVGVLLPRSRWIADLIAELPETAPAINLRKGPGSEARIRLVNSAGEVVYQWGTFQPEETAESLAAMPLSNPLSAWRLEYFADEKGFASVGRSAYWNLFGALAAVALGLIVVAVYFYREYAREMREAVQRVNFVNQVSHELKTPLTNIRMYAELLETDLEHFDAEEAAASQAHLQVIVTESQRLSRLIANVLTFARQRRNKITLRKTPARADEVIAAVIERFRPGLAQKEIEVAFDAGAGDTVMLDADALEQILGNLISNVEKYAAEGKHMKIVSRQDDRQTTIVVADRGPGIPSAVQKKIFRPFYRVSDRIEGATGTGIGLSIARKLARLHGGDVVLLPSDSGTRFEVTLDTPQTEHGGAA